jgi:hypothetical protein
MISALEDSMRGLLPEQSAHPGRVQWINHIPILSCGRATCQPRSQMIHKEHLHIFDLGWKGPGHPSDPRFLRLDGILRYSDFNSELLPLEYSRSIRK